MIDNSFSTELFVQTIVYHFKTKYIVAGLTRRDMTMGTILFWKPKPLRKVASTPI